MSIEILYLLPIVAFSTFLFVILVYRQNQKNKTGQRPSAFAPKPSAAENALATRNAESRLKEIEETTTQITAALSSHQQVVSRFTEENDFYKKELGALKSKLREIQKEYDIVLSENYSLRARVHKLKDNLDQQEFKASGSPNNDPAATDAFDSLPAGEFAAASAPTESSGAVNRSLYEDTRLLAITQTDDGAQVDVVDLDR